VVVRPGTTVTAGTAFSHIVIALALIRQTSSELASLMAKIPGSRCAPFPVVLRDLGSPNPYRSTGRALRTLGARASRSRILTRRSGRRAATSKRTLARRLKDTLGKTPLSYFQDLRVERAVHLLKTTDHNIERIAAMVGYADGVTLRTLLRRRLGRGVRELRAMAG